MTRGFGCYGQLSQHLYTWPSLSTTPRVDVPMMAWHLRWVLHVAAIDVEEVTAMTHRSARSGADLMDAALIRCKGGVALTVSGGCGWPGNEHGDEATGKHFDMKTGPSP